MSDPTHLQPTTIDDVDQADEDLAEALADELVEGLEVGDLVKVSHRDPQCGVPDVEVVRFGQVVDVDDDGAARVAYFAEISDPIPADPDAHERYDAPRVELIS